MNSLLLQLSMHLCPDRQSCLGQPGQMIFCNKMQNLSDTFSIPTQNRGLPTQHSFVFGQSVHFSYTDSTEEENKGDAVSDGPVIS